MSQLLAVIVSLLVEVPVVRVLVGRLEPEAESWRVWAFAAAATLLTHPLAWWGALELMAVMRYATVVVLVEAVVVLAETLFFALVARWRWSTALLAAAVSNVASTLVGLAMWELI